MVLQTILRHGHLSSVPHLCNEAEEDNNDFACALPGKYAGLKQRALLSQIRTLGAYRYPAFQVWLTNRV